MCECAAAEAADSARQSSSLALTETDVLALQGAADSLSLSTLCFEGGSALSPILLF